MGTVTRLAPPAVPEVAGYVEAATVDRVLGWAWAPRRPGLRAAVELRLGDEVVAAAVADRPREDLAASGIGDGRHAFELLIPESCRDRAGELRILARAGEAEPVQIGPPPAAGALSDQIGRMTRALDALVASQRLLHRNLQAALAARSDGGGEAALARLAEVQAKTAEQLSAVERFVVRLDERLAALARPDESPNGGAVPRAASAALWALAASAAALLVSAGGLVRSLGG